MKKLICFLLLVVVCIVLIGCEFSGVQDTTTSTTPKRIEPSERDSILDELELDYSNDFDEYDVEFIKMMRYETMPGLPGYDYRPNFQDAMRALSVENNTFYKIKVDISNALYFIAVYENPELGCYFGATGGLVELQKWRKYYNLEDILADIDGWNLAEYYAVYNCNVEEDILNDVVYNQFCKYYVPWFNGDLEEAGEYALYEYMTWLDLSGHLGRNTPLTILHTAELGYYYSYCSCYEHSRCKHSLGRDVYGYYMDENGLEYLSLSSSSTIQSIVDQYWKK